MHDLLGLQGRRLVVLSFSNSAAVREGEDFSTGLLDVALVEFVAGFSRVAS